jgi:hypothetical protein
MLILWSMYTNKIQVRARCLWLMPVIIATQEAEMRRQRLKLEASPGK